MRAMLLDLFGGAVALTVYELGSPQQQPQQQPARPGRQLSGREAQMQKYDEHRARLQAQGVAADAHRASQQAGKGQGRAGGGRASRRAERKMQRRESQDEPRSPAPAP